MTKGAAADQRRSAPRGTQTSEEPREQQLQLVLFRLAERMFAFPLAVVVEVLPMVAITPVTGSPEWLPGAINLRGQTLPVIDLRRRLAFSPMEPDVHAAIIVTQPEERDPIGFMVDRVLEVTNIPGDAVDPVDALGGEAHPVEGLGRIEERVIVILNVDRLTTGQRDLGLPEMLR